MLTTACQRWRARRASYRPIGETIDPHAYEVAPIATDNEARAFVCAHHYSGSYPAARYRAGLYARGGGLVGVAVLSVPSSQAALDAALPYPGTERAELGRLVLLDHVPANAESWFLTQALRLAREHKGIEYVVSHSDPMPRVNARGERVFVGHIGTVYQAMSATFVGLTERRTRRVLPDGRTLDNATIGKVRRRASGWEYGTRLLMSYGASEPTGEWTAWVRSAVEQVSRPVRHTGNYRYLFGTDRRARRSLPAGQRYPKVTL